MGQHVKKSLLAHQWTNKFIFHKDKIDYRLQDGPRFLGHPPGLDPGRLWALRTCLTLSFTPFERLSRVTHADVSMMHVFIMQYACIHDACIHNACIHDASIHNARIIDAVMHDALWSSRPGRRSVVIYVNKQEGCFVGYKVVFEKWQKYIFKTLEDGLEDVTALSWRGGIASSLVKRSGLNEHQILRARHFLFLLKLEKKAYLPCSLLFYSKLFHSIKSNV